MTLISHNQAQKQTKRGFILGGKLRSAFKIYAYITQPDSQGLCVCMRGKSEMLGLNEIPTMSYIHICE